MVNRRKPTTTEETYAVGYGRPPLHTRFKPGQSGNPKGRPKGLHNVKTDIQEVLRAPITVSLGGKTRRISTQRATLLKLTKRALDGEVRALALLLSLAQAYNNEDPAIFADVSDDDSRVLAIFEDRVRRGATGTSKAREASATSGEANTDAGRNKQDPPARQRLPVKRVRSKRRGIRARFALACKERLLTSALRSSTPPFARTSARSSPRYSRRCRRVVPTSQIGISTSSFISSGASNGANVAV